ncbi:RNA polymerase II transcription factor [Cryptococcus wingfieldii CBS 7118]|uniref:RNA polymerase II transcription factor n=1 Tax=Cryptococcus wingfieldii CBS 7118 TaxID=1295528 RepID=A0A1E3IK14_9TREE|nr:RNA polymerase II transcription factor [Cryptococcus wingfieldii CBS 7118]ODN88775.1 RNA polymerase II transcription factor [Cryptococcus wingfieldii CBS 7118]
MSFAAPEERYNNYNAYRPPTSSHGAPLSPDQRIHSSHGYAKPPTHESPSQVYQEHPLAPVPSHGYPPQSQPMTPLTSNSYPPAAQAGSYYTIPGQAQAQGEAIPSPPPSSANPVRPDTANSGSGEFAAPAAPTQTTEGGVPIVPVGVSGGKLFRCRGYGECDKVFTRSEHLARHVRKHTGERPFPCHCGKAFSRLDNLRQHAATVHSEQTGLNETMLASLGPIHAALSQRASKDQRRRGEVVEVPKNAVERRQSEYRTRGGSASSSQPNAAQGTAPPSQTNSPYTAYHDPQWASQPHSRPRTSGGYDYPYAAPDHQQSLGEDAGPSRRPGSAAGYGYQQDFYAGANGRSGSAAGPPPGEMGSLPYPYRPMSSQGRDLPVPTHYAESEPPASAHGPPESPMYANVPNPQQPAWSSPPTNHSAYPPHDAAAYPAPEGYTYSQGHGAYPPREEVYEYPPQSAAGWQGGYPPSHGSYPQGYNGAPQPDSPFQYNIGHPGAPGAPGAAAGAPPAGAEGYSYSSGGYDRKRRAEDDGDHARKHARHASGGQGTAAGNASAVSLNAALEASTGPGAPGAPGVGRGGAGGIDSWLPPTTERRGSLAISALLGSPKTVAELDGAGLGAGERGSPKEVDGKEGEKN